MAEKKRDYVWLECMDCGAKNYRTERRMGQDMKQKKSPANMDEQNRLVLKKFCRNERKHTMHRESRKK